MTFKSIYQHFQLSDVASGFGASLIPPLALVAAAKKQPLLVLSYDHKKRIVYRNSDGYVLNLPRVESLCTHVNVTIVADTGQAPACAAFSAACLSQIPTGKGAFGALHPERDAEAASVYGVLQGLSAWQKIRHPHLRRCVAGEVIDESGRVCDSFASIPLKNDRQVSAALAEIDQWTSNPPDYEVRAITGENCATFVAAIVRSAGVGLPAGFGVKPWPGTHAGIFLPMRAGNKLSKAGEWTLQPRAVTLKMYESAVELMDPADRLACFAQRPNPDSKEALAPAHALGEAA